MGSWGSNAPCCSISRPAKASKARSSGDGGAVAWRAASRYVAARSRNDALDTAARLLEQGHAVSVDLSSRRAQCGMVDGHP
jgi:hypothetical protein